MMARATRRNILFSSALVLVAAALLGLVWFIGTAPELPPESEAIIDSVLANELPELVKGITGTAKSGDVDIWFEAISNVHPRATVLLIMGAGSFAIAWSEQYLQPLINAGYQVIRYDNRGVGMSDWMEVWDSDRPYTVEDMAKDGIAVLDEMGVARAHIVGMSMGGMIGQRMALSYPDRVLSLTCMSSSGYLNDPELPSVSPQFERDFIRLVLRYGLIRTERNLIKLIVGLQQLLKGDGTYSTNVEWSAQATLYELRQRNGFNPEATEQHTAAVGLSGSRYDELRHISVPTLIVHGRSDPLIPYLHAVKYARMIPGARTLWVEGMGHDVADAHAPQILSAIKELLQVVEGQNSEEPSAR